VQLDLTLTVAAAMGGRQAAGDLVAEGVVVNTGTSPLEIDLVELASPSLALEVLDGSGAPVRMPPPPTPGRPELIVLAPGMRRSVAFRAFLTPATPPGRYRIRLRYRDARSPWSEFEIR
jgi:hypothetical protein